jgi:hypothetical protein
VVLFVTGLMYVFRGVLSNRAFNTLDTNGDDMISEQEAEAVRKLNEDEIKELQEQR